MRGCDDGNDATEVMPYAQCYRATTVRLAVVKRVARSVIVAITSRNLETEECDNGSVANSNTVPDACQL